MRARIKQRLKELAIDFAALTRSSEPQLRVLLFHHLPQSTLPDFELLISALTQHFQFISAATFEKILRREERLQRHSLLLTFDDGFRSQFEAAEKVLEPRGITALFFIPTAFLDCRSTEAARAYVASRLCAGRISPSEVAADLTPMSWEQLRILNSRGHAAGSHTVNHPAIGALSSDLLLLELQNSKSRLSAELECDIKHFAYPFGNSASVNSSALKKALESYPFVHTGLRGDNRQHGSPAALIWRESLAPDCGAKFGVATALGALDWWYALDRRRLLRWVEHRS
ncbi:MAG: polysaccharide deacetylase family protein [Oligoflexia bacterium]|nr:polysaccharide deacetylase family protein [Oligoflexia bacterium]